MTKELMLMNVKSGYVQTEQEWASEGYTVDNAALIVVEWDSEFDGWVEV